MQRTPLDIIFRKTAQDQWADDSSSRAFEFYFQNTKVGKCSTRLCQHAYALCDNHRFFPTTWFNQNTEIGPMGTQAPLKPFLEVTNFDFSNFQAKGFGRMGLQKMYQLSQKLGAEGRIYLTAKKKETSLREPATFYEHCGFKGNEGHDCRKYFTPNPENIHALFSKPSLPDFLIKEVPVQDNGISLINPRTGQFRITQKLKEILERQKN